MTSYHSGDVILVDIAFSGAVGYKRRPALVISSDNFNSAGIKLIFLLHHKHRERTFARRWFT
jgi:mRNA-degrading endonuclease toxin of MazEF toxin-antitoxin module